MSLVFSAVSTAAVTDTAAEAVIPSSTPNSITGGADPRADLGSSHHPSDWADHSAD